MRSFFILFSLFCVVNARVVGVDETISFTYNNTETVGNPYVGFFPYTHTSSPPYNFPHSMEFSYFKMSDVMTDWNTFHFDSIIDPKLDSAAGRNHTFVFRLYVDYPGEGSTAVPDFLVEGLTFTPYANYGGGNIPDYFNVTLIDAMVQVISALGAKYDGDGRVAFIQVGFLGFWGEWHTYPITTPPFPNLSIQSRILDAYNAAFKTTMVVVSQDSLGYDPHYDFSSNRVGFHDDSFSHSTVGNPDWYFANTLSDEGYSNNYLLVPIGGEIYPDIQGTIFENPPPSSENNFTECVLVTHASWLLNDAAFFPGYDGDELENAITGATLLGYEFWIPALSVHRREDPADEIEFSVKLANSGVAPFYYPLALEIVDYSTSPVTVLATTSLSDRDPPPTTTKTVVVTVGSDKMPESKEDDEWKVAVRLHCSSLPSDGIPIVLANDERLVDHPGLLPLTVNLTSAVDGSSTSPMSPGVRGSRTMSGLAVVVLVSLVMLLAE